LHALEAASRIERGALRAGVQFGAAPLAPAFEADGLLDDRATLRAPDNLPEARHVDISRPIL
jgi:hypothetical protein